MSEKINWTLSVRVVGGPKISESQALIVQALTHALGQF